MRKAQAVERLNCDCEAQSRFLAPENPAPYGLNIRAGIIGGDWRTRQCTRKCRTFAILTRLTSRKKQRASFSK
eukprot:scaffold250462_cov51-Prasinocladus_malaysianus.AAC.1